MPIQSIDRPLSLSGNWLVLLSSTCISFIVFWLSESEAPGNMVTTAIKGASDCIMNGIDESCSKRGKRNLRHVGISILYEVNIVSSMQKYMQGQNKFEDEVRPMVCAVIGPVPRHRDRYYTTATKRSDNLNVSLLGAPIFYLSIVWPNMMGETGFCSISLDNLDAGAILSVQDAENVDNIWRKPSVLRDATQLREDVFLPRLRLQLYTNRAKATSAYRSYGMVRLVHEPPLATPNFILCRPRRVDGLMSYFFSLKEHPEVSSFLVTNGSKGCERFQRTCLTAIWFCFFAYRLFLGLLWWMLQNMSHSIPKYVFYGVIENDMHYAANAANVVFGIECIENMVLIRHVTTTFAKYS